VKKLSEICTFGVWIGGVHNHLLSLVSGIIYISIEAPSIPFLHQNPLYLRMVSDYIKLERPPISVPPSPVGKSPLLPVTNSL
jgi:hypothetical protein